MIHSQAAGFYETIWHAQREFGCSETGIGCVKPTDDDQGMEGFPPVEDACTPSRSCPGSRVSARVQLMLMLVDHFRELNRTIAEQYPLIVV